jgi:sRNA-binding protein
VQNNIKVEAKQQLQIEKSQLVVTPCAPKQNVDTGNEIKVYWALSRRAIAMDQCGLISYSVQMLWVQSLMEAMAEESPPGYAKVNIAQALRADKELFTMLARRLPGPYRATGTAAPPCDAVVQQLVNHARIQQLLLPLPGKGGRQTEQADADSDDAPTKPRPKKKAKAQPKKPTAAATKPPELASFDCKHEGKPVCWWFNVAAGCQQKIVTGKQADTARCKFGLHVCAKCKKNNHGLSSCRSKE